MTQRMRFKINPEAQSYCPIATCAEVLADRWSVIVLRDIAICNHRTFRAILANNNEKISSGVLASRLQRLCDIGLLHFKDDPSHAQRKIYCLSSEAIDLVPILVDMAAWALMHAAPAEEPIAVPKDMMRAPSEYSKTLTQSLRLSHLDQGEAAR